MLLGLSLISASPQSGHLVAQALTVPAIELQDGGRTSAAASSLGYAQVNPMAARYAAKGDGTSDDTNALQAAIDEAGTEGTLVFPPRAVFRVSGLKLKEYTKIIAWGAKLVPAGPAQTVLTIPSGATLQTNGKALIEGLEIDGKGQPETTGLRIENHAQIELIAPFIHDCGAVGLFLHGTQFADIYAPRLLKNYVGVKIYSEEMSGGGNSNNFFGGQIVGNIIGVLQFSPKFLQTSNYFYNTSMLANSEAAVAVIGSNAGSTLYLIGGAPEGNAPASAPSFMIVDGHKISRAALYVANFSTVYVDEVFIADALAAPWSIVENHSKIAFHNAQGYGIPTESLVVADGTSSVLFTGDFSAVGHVSNIGAWPSSVSTQSGLWAGFGQPLYASTDVSNWFRGDAATPLLTGKEIRATRFDIDPVFGQVNNAEFDAKPGNSEINRVTFGGLIRSSSETSDVLVSLLMKPIANCALTCGFQVGLYPGGNAYGISVNLVEGRWTRVVVFIPSWPGGKDVGMVAYPTDSSGATIDFARVQISYGAHGSEQTLQDFSQVVGTGAVGGVSGNPSRARSGSVTGSILLCTSAGKLPVGTLTTDASACGASADTGLTIP